MNHVSHTAVLLYLASFSQLFQKLVQSLQFPNFISKLLLNTFLLKNVQK